MAIKGSEQPLFKNVKMSCVNFSGPCDAPRWVGWKECAIWFAFAVSINSINTSVVTAARETRRQWALFCPVCVCVPTRTYRYSASVCVYVLSAGRCTQVYTSMSVCMDCHRIHGRRLPPSDLTQPWTMLPLRSIRIVYPTPSLSSRLIHGGVKHLVMLNHSGAQHARSHPEWQGGGRLRDEIPHRPQGKEEGEGGEEGLRARRV